MNKFKISLLAISLTIGSTAFGASIDLIQNYSAEYGGNPAQQGAINQGSSVYFNPAGLMRLENGTYFVGGLQYAFGTQKITNGNEFSSDLSSPIPNLALYKKTDDGALFWTLGGVAGGAGLNYKDGIPVPIDLGPLTLKNAVEGSNNYAQTTIGKAYNLTDKWSASVAVRGVYGIRDLKADAELVSPTGTVLGTTSIDSERTAAGVGAQFGLNYAPNDRLNIGFRYDTKVKLNFETKGQPKETGLGSIITNQLLNEFPVYKDGEKIRRDLPAIAALGASYKVTDRWTTFVGGNYYFNESATMDRVGKTKDYDNGWEVSLGSEYWINNKWAWLVGGNYAKTGSPADNFAATEYALDSVMLGTGVKYKQNENTEWTVAFNHYIYDSQTIDNHKYEKEISSIGVNFSRRF